ncbi:MAG TPA: cytochrome c biogenesis protein CcdA [Spirochaetota bacterium]|nr:cytochrome c biogenesis protein CcdA [Spirochaetota bacterium]OPZ39337.1 MAG: Thiol:disulfide interchange protein DsbD precursor [Spirochaetes bacterium ADurb.BinA120]HNU90328.1 cytochrome c biogenesis protein CcdA [Spirochaetota bacterium]HPI13146.1 cytochrome c biogenesis protein CcdA [Spirochaetota bacterium]HPV96451.1 cytochrome c biogenesis protein CcdA [Spirochaetota bacterium]
MARPIIIRAFTAFMTISLFTAPSAARGNDELSAAIDPMETSIPAGGNGLLIIQLDIPKGSYIYGNPKGPGIGKATSVRVSPEPGLVFGSTRFLPPRKYTPAGEKDFVWIYEKKTSILIPVDIAPGTKPSIRTPKISIEALLCSHGSCIPQTVEPRASIRVLGPGQTGTSIPAGLLERHSIQSLEATDGKAFSKSPEEPSSDLRFRPRYVSSSAVSNIVQAVILGIIAGFILNFMPCVLPVVSLKLMGFVQHAGERRRTLVRHGLLFSLGILTSFAVLASLGSTLGYNWGELFQKKQFLIAMIAVIFAMGLSLLGVFTIGMPSFVSRVSRDSGNPYIDSYLKGALATLLATPCSGPFLGGTLAFAFTQPPPVIFAIFMSIGLGMALPYLALSAAPGLIRFVPRPGDWSVAFEQLMGFLLLGTAVYLMGILSSENLMPALWFLLILGIGLWQYGRYGNITRGPKSRIISGSVLALLIALGCFFAFSTNDEVEKRAGIASQAAFDMDAIERKSAAGGISIVKFTADWCPNCVLVERTALYTSRVVSLINENSITLYTADITRKNPEAQKLLRELGSRSIPFLAVFPPGDQFNEPICLRDIYSESDVLEAIRIAVSP